MGSYLSVVNDTPDTHYCQVGPDERVLNFFATIVKGARKLVTVVAAATRNAADMLEIEIPEQALEIINVTQNGLDAIHDVTGNIPATIQGARMELLQLEADQLKEEGFFEIPPGDQHRWGKMTLSLLQQAHCIKYTETEDGFTSEEIYLRPIFSASVNNGNREVSITHWIDKKGYEGRAEVKVGMEEEVKHWLQDLGLEELRDESLFSESPYLRGNLAYN